MERGRKRTSYKKRLTRKNQKEIERVREEIERKRVTERKKRE